MSTVKNEIGNKYGKLKVIKRCNFNKNKLAVWECLCDCGSTVNVLGVSLRVGHTTSCGCRRKETLSKLNKKPWARRTMMIWKLMMYRCYSKKNKSYPDYGGRGITVSKDWHTLENFFADMGDIPNELSLDRIDNNKGYSKENCKFSTQSEQVVNSRKRKDGKNKYRNIVFHPQTKKWRLTFMRDKIKYDLGLFEDIEDAVVARNKFKLSRGEIIYE